MKISHLRWAAVALSVSALLTFNAAAQKLDPADVIAKHRAAIGGAAALSAVQNQLVLWNAQFTFKGAAAVIGGKALVFSTSDKNLWAIKFASNDYPQDRFGFDGNTVKVAKSTPTARSLIGDFLYNNKTILREGLLGGTLSATWPLRKDEIKGAKIQFEGRKTVADKDTIVLSYSPKSGSDLTIKLYFDPTTYNHLRTEYTLVRNAAQGSNVDNSAGQSGMILRLTEEFSDFSKLGQLTFPKTYKITFARTGTASSATSQTSNKDAEWTFVVTDIGFNREIDDNSFNVDAK
jgi:hypothetical protein